MGCTTCAKKRKEAKARQQLEQTKNKQATIPAKDYVNSLKNDTK